ncbi:5-oxoprolinase subunit PxpB [Bacillus spizizenii ATCC 6633 = JCM 2499]|uniref:Putative inhibitor of the autophosphorylation reaction of KinA n=1 Tax=Bacillus spizizenii (strain ATCC 23059 / NRRL B-14472 / W23) TaxID=655816 RepID=E0U320_BACSH|nr:5-oxoprolinase subunit B [Bacillus spizizenii]QCJ15805.1 5-oxoprolinase subunit B [Bacillus subtilis]ADM36481.1 putative inhibitor of the autophosphorylation reaction of KinA [Bacillus spizizenii str. W23]AJW85931.1 kinase inhibitor [Bacillus spizizenii]EFG90942.1 putative inhibitor of the autophosphorylation reaction of KinA [Bacillus spizizenii ATCC 6633 = JCM 2499]KFK77174.1 kinase A inhibitor [Bacillus spizizenii]
MTEQFQIELLGDSAMMIRFGEEINEQVNGLVHAAAAYIEEQPFPGFIECIPAFTSLTVFYDMYEVYKHLPQGISSPFEKVKRDVEGRLKEIAIDYENNRRIVEIPVCYGGEFGPDLEEVAKINQLSTEEVIDIHTSGEYVVYMLGFAPGFPFLGGMSKRIAAPRKSSPRPSIPAGSVGIAGMQTGVYPISTPGGWQLIGKTPLALFRPQENPPTLLRAGDIVKFVRISEDDYHAYKEESN